MIIKIHFSVKDFTKCLCFYIVSCVGIEIQVEIISTNLSTKCTKTSYIVNWCKWSRSYSNFTISWIWKNINLVNCWCSSCRNTNNCCCGRNKSAVKGSDSDLISAKSNSRLKSCTSFSSCRLIIQQESISSNSRCSITKSNDMSSIVISIDLIKVTTTYRNNTRVGIVDCTNKSNIWHTIRLGLKIEIILTYISISSIKINCCFNIISFSAESIWNFNTCK